MRWSIFLGMLAAIATNVTAAASSFEVEPHVTTEINLNANSDLTWLPSPEQQAQVLNIVESYLAEIDGARYSEAYEMRHPDLNAHQTLDQFVELEEKFRTIAGPTEFWRVQKVTWSKDPANAPGPGIYAAIDLVAMFEKADRYCGYIILYQENENSELFVLRQEYSLFDNASASSIEAQHSKEHLAQAWAQMSQYCQNYVPPPEIQ